MVSSNEFKALLEIILPRFVVYTSEQKKLSYEDALVIIYESKLYEDIEDESTKLWQLSIPMLYAKLIEEQK